MELVKSSSDGWYLRRSQFNFGEKFEFRSCLSYHNCILHFIFQTRVVKLVGEVMGFSCPLSRLPRWGGWGWGRPRGRKRKWGRAGQPRGWPLPQQHQTHCLLLWYVHLQNAKNNSTGFASGKKKTIFFISELFYFKLTSISRILEDYKPNTFYAKWLMKKCALLKFIYSENCHIILRNLPCRFDWHYIVQIYGGDFSKFCGLLRIYEL